MELNEPVMEELWPAPVATQPLAARIEVPGSKSQTNRLFVLAALADSPSVIHGALQARDTDLMVAALTSLGARFQFDAATGTYRVSPIDLPSQSSTPREVNIDVGLAGTVMRFVPPVAALVGGRFHFDGDDAARTRPVGGLLQALRQLGVVIESEHEPPSLPFTLVSNGITHAGEIFVDSNATSQYISGLLLAAPRLGITEIVTQASVPSQTHIEMTVAALRDRGVGVERGVYLDSPRGFGRELWWYVYPDPIRGGEMWVEPDLSNAAPFLAAALIAGGRVTIPGWPLGTTQPGVLVPGLLEYMGGVIDQKKNSLTAIGTGKIHGITIDLHNAGELVPTFAALAALADSPSRFTGVEHLRWHETNRLAALVNEINSLGGNARELRDGIEITPAPLHGGVWHTYGDHRMATAGALIGLRIPGVQVENIDTTAKTLPDFTKMWDALLAGSHRP